MLNTEVGSQGGYLIYEPKERPRMGYFEVTNWLLDHLLDLNIMNFLRAGVSILPGDVPEWKPMAERIADELLLPDNCDIDAVSQHCQFRYDVTAFRVLCPDFVETPEGYACLPDVGPMYCETVDLLGKKVCHFAGWSSGTVLGYQPPPRPDTSRCSEELGHFSADLKKCYCGQLVYDEVDYEWGWMPSFAFGENKHHRMYGTMTRPPQHISDTRCVFVPKVELPEGPKNPVPNWTTEPATPMTVPSPLLSWDEHRAALNWCVANFGVAYEWMVPDGKGGTAEVWPLPPDWVIVPCGADAHRICLPGSAGQLLIPSGEVYKITEGVVTNFTDRPYLAIGGAAMDRVKEHAHRGWPLGVSFAPPSLAELTKKIKQLAAQTVKQPLVEEPTIQTAEMPLPAMTEKDRGLLLQGMRDVGLKVEVKTDLCAICLKPEFEHEAGRFPCRAEEKRVNFREFL